MHEYLFVLVGYPKSIELNFSLCCRLLFLIDNIWNVFWESTHMSESSSLLFYRRQSSEKLLLKAIKNETSPPVETITAYIMEQKNSSLNKQSQHQKVGSIIENISGWTGLLLQKEADEMLENNKSNQFGFKTVKKNLSFYSFLEF